MSPGDSPEQALSHNEIDIYEFCDRRLKNIIKVLIHIVTMLVNKYQIIVTRIS